MERREIGIFGGALLAVAGCASPGGNFETRQIGAREFVYDPRNEEIVRVQEGRDVLFDRARLEQGVINSALQESCYLIPVMQPVAYIGKEIEDLIEGPVPRYSLQLSLEEEFKRNLAKE